MMRTSTEPSDTPEAVTPAYTTSEPNQPVHLWSGEFDADVSGTQTKVTGDLHLVWTPTPRLELSGKSADEVWLKAWGSDGGVSVTLPDSKQPSKAMLSSWTIGSRTDGGDLRLLLQEPVVLARAPLCHELLLHVVNLPDYRGAPIKFQGGATSVAHLEYAVGSWRVTLDGVRGHSQLYKRLCREGGYGLTHVARVFRKNGKPFNPKDADAVLDAFRWFLCFWCGRFVGIPIRVGRNCARQTVYEEWISPLVSSERSVLSWMPDFHVSETEPLLQRFHEVWRTKFWRDTVMTAVHWYVVANLCVAALEGSIALAQIALEKLAWAVLVEKHKSLSKKGFDSLPAADNLRLLLATMGIPGEIPDSLPGLQRMCGKFQCKDIPEAITRIRNDIVHPVGQGYSRATIEEAWSASLWCLELALLRLLDYRGHYTNRLAANYAEEPVPWLANGHRLRQRLVQACSVAPSGRGSSSTWRPWSLVMRRHASTDGRVTGTSDWVG